MYHKNETEPLNLKRKQTRKIIYASRCSQMVEMAYINEFTDVFCCNVVFKAAFIWLYVATANRDGQQQHTVNIQRKLYDFEE